MFNKDLLLIDIEATGLDSRKYDLIQLAAVLLDRKTLKEKKSFTSYIKPIHRKRDPESMAVNGISENALLTAPGGRGVLLKFNRTFGRDLILAHYAGVMDITFLRTAYDYAGLKWPYDHHIFNIWAILYTYAAKRNLLTDKTKFAGFGLESLAEHFGIPTGQMHDALADCRLEAEILRRVLKSFPAWTQI